MSPKIISVASFLVLLSCLGALPTMSQLAHLRFEPEEPSPFDRASNLFLHATVVAPRHWSDRVPEFATDGKRNNAGDHWAGEDVPVWLTVELPEPREINTIRMWTYWDNRRYYQYVIEGSLEGKQWTILVDNRSTTTPQSEVGETLHFPSAKVRFVRTTFTHNSASNQAGGHIVEIEGFLVDTQQVAVLRQRDERWRQMPPGLHGAVGSIDVRYPRDEVPSLEAVTQWSGVAWRGERLNAQVVLWSRTGARQVRFAASTPKDDEGNELKSSGLHPSFVRYVLADGKVVPDALDDTPRVDMAPQTVRPLWITVDIPHDAKPGKYSGQLRVLSEGGSLLPFEFKVEVLPEVLPPPSQWSFHLDLWQNPFALARYHRVAPWSQDHLRLLEPHLRLLASAGQKCITTTLVHQPWGTQTFDPYDSMVEWIRLKEGRWKFDYTHFDQYVALAMRCGITESINCYSMVPWGNRFRYLDAATGDHGFAYANPGSPEYEKHWEPFLRDFVAHLRKRGWLEKTHIAMDERPVEEMKPMVAFLKRVAPQLKVALAGSNSPEFKDTVDDWCAFISPPLDPSVARERRGRGKPTTFYVCCGPAKPNTFTFSPPAESAWLGWYAAAQGYSGFLRWAFDSWVEDPLYDTSFVTWPAGDCFLVYPGARSSIRFERLREGIQDYEKIRLLRLAMQGRTNKAAREALKRLSTTLSHFTYESVQHVPAEETVREAKGHLDELSRALGAQSHNRGRR